MRVQLWPYFGKCKYSQNLEGGDVIEQSDGQLMEPISIHRAVCIQAKLEANIHAYFLWVYMLIGVYVW
jgi:hypothetical protein